MPQRGRSRRMAARQAQLGQRKKRHTPGASGIPSTTDALPVTRAGDGAEPLGAKAADASRPQPIAGQRPSPGRQAEPRPAVYAYVKSELKRIAGLSAGILAILIILTFVLR